MSDVIRSGMGHEPTGPREQGIPCSEAIERLTNANERLAQDNRNLEGLLRRVQASNTKLGEELQRYRDRADHPKYDGGAC